ncbi:MAG: KpsF/GutQ family sugar-phosphate isomerase [Pseudomonadota bacterium]
MQNRDEVMATGRRVLSLEAKALSKFADELTEAFVAAVDMMLQAKGRIIVSGMGKSGHVGKKIAATLASTGTPAQFVHPAEASHGDLGMITDQDVALVLSNSGETKELADIIAHTRRFKIPLIGVASRPGSTLLRQSDIALPLPQAPEACSVGMAPTTSTTLTIALGDALAVALMERRAFTQQDYGVFHPGGTLGAQLIDVATLMTTGDGVPLIAEDAPMSEALLVMSEKGFGVAGTVDHQGRLTGVITDGDLRRNMEGLLDRTAGDVATGNPRTIAPEALAQEALAEMNSRIPRITTLFVTQPEGTGEPLGILHMHDCLRAGVDERPRSEGKK